MYEDPVVFFIIVRLEIYLKMITQRN
jgi:hypothetical protein